MKPHVCSWRIGFFLDNALRRMIHDPEAILGHHVAPGQTAVDIGCGPGFFTLPLAKRVGETGTVVAADLQPQMLERVRVKAERAGINGWLRLHRCGTEQIGLAVRADFILAFYMAHEVPDKAAFFQQIQTILKPSGRFLLVEPKFHVSAANFAEIVAAAEQAGLVRIEPVRVALSRGGLFTRRQT